VHGEERSISNVFLKPETAQGHSGDDLCALWYLFVYALVFIRGASRKRQILIFLKQKRSPNRGEPGERRDAAIHIE
jgi:hypothetical protein